MKEIPLRIEFRRILESVLKEGTYTEGHLMLLEKIANQPRIELQQMLKDALGINDCSCEF